MMIWKGLSRDMGDVIMEEDMVGVMAADGVGEVVIIEDMVRNENLSESALQHNCDFLWSTGGGWGGGYGGKIRISKHESLI